MIQGLKKNSFLCLHVFLKVIVLFLSGTEMKADSAGLRKQFLTNSLQCCYSTYCLTAPSPLLLCTNFLWECFGECYLFWCNYLQFFCCNISLKHMLIKHYWFFGTLTPLLFLLGVNFFSAKNTDFIVTKVIFWWKASAIIRQDVYFPFYYKF